MKFTAKITAALLLLSALAHAQDILKLSDNTELKVRIQKMDADLITYTVDESGNYFYAAKNDVEQITYADGKTENVTHTTLSVTEAQAKIISLINSYGFADKSDNRVKATFDTNNLRVIEMNPAGTKEAGNEMIYDMAGNMVFHPISLRKDNLAYVNIWLSKVDKGKYIKLKMSLRTDNREHAELLRDTFKSLHKAQKEQKKQ